MTIISLAQPLFPHPWGDYFRISEAALQITARKGYSDPLLIHEIAHLYLQRLFQADPPLKKEKDELPVLKCLSLLMALRVLSDSQKLNSLLLKVGLWGKTLVQDFEVLESEFLARVETTIHIDLQTPSIQPLIQELRECQYDLNLQDHHGKTLLYYACALGKTALIKDLLENGANPNLGSLRGMYPLHIACERRNPPVISQLLAHQANIQVINDKGETPLHVACALGDLLCAKRLLTHQADLQAADFNGNTPLHHTIHAGRSEVAQLVIEKGGNMNAQNHAGDTPLHLAIRGSCYSLVALLLARGASTDVPNAQGVTADDLAASLPSKFFNFNGSWQQKEPPELPASLPG